MDQPQGHHAPQRHAAEGPDAQVPESTDAQARAGPEQVPEGPGAQVHEGPAEVPEEAPVRGERGKGKREERENSSPFPRSMRKCAGMAEGERISLEKGPQTVPGHTEEVSSFERQGAESSR